MKVYKLFRIKKDKLYPLFVEANTELPMGMWLNAVVGKKADDNHVKSKLGPLSLRPGFHSCTVPFTDWIGKKGEDGKLYQKSDTVWCECEVDGNQINVKERNGLRTIPNGWYYFRTKSEKRQPFPWIISKRIYIKRIVDYSEVQRVCRENGVEAQLMYD